AHDADRTGPRARERAHAHVAVPGAGGAARGCAADPVVARRQQQSRPTGAGRVRGGARRFRACSRRGTELMTKMSHVSGAAVKGGTTAVRTPRSGRAGLQACFLALAAATMFAGCREVHGEAAIAPRPVKIMGVRAAEAPS